MLLPAVDSDSWLCRVEARRIKTAPCFLAPARLVETFK
jgi:hypothetical protein